MRLSATGPLETVMRCDVRLSLSPRLWFPIIYLGVHSLNLSDMLYPVSGISAIRGRKANQATDASKHSRTNGNTRRADCAYVLPIPAGSSVAPAVHTHSHPLVSRVRPHLPPTIQTRRRRLVALCSPAVAFPAVPSQLSHALIHGFLCRLLPWLPRHPPHEPTARLEAYRGAPSRPTTRKVYKGGDACAARPFIP